MIRLAVRCSAELADLVLAELLQVAPGGVEETEAGGGLTEYAIYGSEGELPDLGGLAATAGEGTVEITSEVIPDDWADRWRDFHEPASIAGGRAVIRPSWYPASDAAIDVVVDPGQAFGTGAHPTTRMCVELLLGLADAGHARGALADLGTGSGVLAIVATKLGWSPVAGVDSERAAIVAASENAAANGVALDLRRANLREDAPPRAPTLVANLTAPLLREVAAALDRPPKRLVCSGLLAHEAHEVRQAFAAAGLEEAARLDSGDWSALLLERL